MAITTTEQQYTEEQIFEALQLTYEDWKSSNGPFSFENVPSPSRLDELQVMTREQFNQFVSELNYLRCGKCGVFANADLCENHYAERVEGRG